MLEQTRCTRAAGREWEWEWCSARVPRYSHSRNPRKERLDTPLTCTSPVRASLIPDLNMPLKVSEAEQSTDLCPDSTDLPSSKTNLTSASSEQLRACSRSMEHSPWKCMSWSTVPAGFWSGLHTRTLPVAASPLPAAIFLAEQ
jgi:hypothetical protein